MSRITRHRRSHTFTGKRLKRGRRLYAFIIYNSFIKNPEMLVIYAQRARAIGLWSQSSSLRDVAFSLARYVFKEAKKRGWRAKTSWSKWDKSWYFWSDEFKWDVFARYDIKRHKYGKPALRLVA